MSHPCDRETLQCLLKESSSAEDFARRWEQAKKAMEPEEMLVLALKHVEGMGFLGLAEETDQSPKAASRLLSAAAPAVLQALNINPG